MPDTMTRPDTVTLCELHSLPIYTDGEWHPGACPNCYRDRFRCDFGECPHFGRVRVSALGPREPAPEGSRDGGWVRRILETRRVCPEHVRDMLRGYHAAGVELCYLDGLGRNMAWHRASDPLEPAVGSPSRWWAAE